MSSQAQAPLVLVTGITGFLSAHVLDSLLASPEHYRIRGTLRSIASKGDALLSRLDASQRARVELVEVKATESSDLSEALKGVDYVLHVASPYQLNVEDVQRDLLTPAKEGTLNVLRYAAKEPSVKFVGITSSFAAVTDLNKGGPNRPGFTYTESDWNPAGEKEALDFGGQGAFAYSASKKIAEKAAFDFVQQEKPQFTVSSFNPPMIYGPTLQPSVTRKTLNTSSATIYNLISNAPAMPADRLPLFCHARDVADAHVRAITKHARGTASNRRFLLCGGKFNWAMAVHFFAESRPELKGRLPKGWEQAKPEEVPVERYASLDTSASEEVLGMQFRDWQTTLGETVDSLVELEKGEGWEK